MDTERNPFKSIAAEVGMEMTGQLPTLKEGRLEVRQQGKRLGKFFVE